MKKSKSKPIIVQCGFVESKDSKTIKNGMKLIYGIKFILNSINEYN